MSMLHPSQAEQWLMDPAVSIRDVQKYINLIAYKQFAGAWQDRPFNLARLALEIRIAEEASHAAEKLSRQTDGLSKNIEALVAVAKEQKELAQKLDFQTEKIINLTKALVRWTWVLVLLTVGLLALGAVEQIRVVLKENSKQNVQHDQAHQLNEKP